MPFVVPSAAKREIAFPGVVAEGASGVRARRVQEWLTFHDFGTAIDGDFGPATAEAVRRFQSSCSLPVTGRVNARTWRLLVEPLSIVLQVSVPRAAHIDSAILAIARAHLQAKPVELGGDNRGPWVRTYTGGYDGAGWRWCAAFASFVLNQACALIDKPSPVDGSASCDSLAYQAKIKGRFVNGRSIISGETPWSRLGECQIFLVARTATDWVHAGFAFAGAQDVFRTVEGNTDDVAGSANGYKVCERTRSVPGKDFIQLAT